MIKSLYFILNTFILAITSKALGQNPFPRTILVDSLVRNYKIKQVTEHWFLDTLKSSSANTTIENYNSIGQITDRIYINYLHHKFVDSYTYHPLKKEVTEIRVFYNWNHHIEKRKGDTIVKKTVTTYDMITGNIAHSKSSLFESYVPKFNYDTNGRIVMRTDTLKLGHLFTYYSYNNKGKVLERKQYTKHPNKEMRLNLVDSFFYNEQGLLTKELSFGDIETVGETWNFGNISSSTMRYYPNGLLAEKRCLSQYPKVHHSENTPTVYRYEYVFY